MPNAKKIFMVSDLRLDAVQMFKDNPLELAKGFIRLSNKKLRRQD
jgi:hypothetical protein